MPTSRPRRYAATSFSFVALATALFGLATLRCNGTDESSGDSDDAGVDARRTREAGPPAPDAEPSTWISLTEGAGSRFVPLYVHAKLDDGAEGHEFVTFFDTELNRDCAFREFGSDEWHCVPRTVTGRAVYAESSCTVPRLAARPARDDDKWIEWGTGCERKVAPFSGPTYASQLLYARKSDGSCAADTISESLDIPVEMSLSAFGEFVRSIDTTAFPSEKNGSRLTIESDRLDGADGSFVVLEPRIIDAQTGKAGRARRADDGQFRFLPASFESEGFTGMFADATCTQRGISIPSSAACHEDTHAPDHVLLQAVDAPHCLAFRAVKSTATPLVGYFRTDGNACVFEAGPAGWSGAFVPEDSLAALPAATLPLLERTLVPNESLFKGGSLTSARSYRFTSADGFEMRERNWRLWLTKYNVPCRVVTYADGTERCAPMASSVDRRHAFLDSECTQPLVGTLHDSCETPSPFLETYSGPQGHTTYKRPAQSVAVPASIFQKDPDGSCVSTPASADTYVYYAAPLEEVAPTEFPKVVTSIVRPGAL